jgi:hypothetical protein
MHEYRSGAIRGDAGPLNRSQRKGGIVMSLKKIAMCAAALLIATIASQLAQAGGKGGVSAIAPGHTTAQPAPPPTDPGKSVNAPGDLKKDNGTAAKTYAPGQKK